MADSNENGGGMALVMLDEPIQKELERMRQGGAALVEKKRIVNEVTKVVAGLTWGDVRGVNLSPQAQYSIAEFCYVTGANPHVHLDILGNRPYLNVQYWQDLLNADDHYLGYEQINISKGVSEQLRKLSLEAKQEATNLLKEAESLSMPELRDDAVKARRRAADLQAQASRVEELRVFFEVPPEVSASYVTTIRRYRAGAPLDAIMRGEIDAAAWIVEVSECNHAGKNSDPVGKTNPGTTARSRSFRRAAVKAFSAWLGRRDKEIERAEKMIEANFKVLSTDSGIQAQLANHAAQRPALRAGNGEPTVTGSDMPLGRPVDNMDPEPDPSTPGDQADAVTPTPAQTTTASTEPPPAVDQLTPEERDDLRKGFWATFREAGFKPEERAEWQEENNLPESTGTWTRADYDRARKLLEAPTRAELVNAAGAIGYESVSEYLSEKQLDTPRTLKDMKALLARMQSEA